MLTRRSCAAALSSLLKVTAAVPARPGGRLFAKRRMSPWRRHPGTSPGGRRLRRRWMGRPGDLASRVGEPKDPCRKDGTTAPGERPTETGLVGPGATESVGRKDGGYPVQGRG